MMAWTLLIVGETFQSAFPADKLESQAAAGADGASDSLTTAQVQFGTDTVTVIHFHPTVQCSCCINVGSFSKEALEKYYAAPLKKDLIVFRECNIDQDSLTPARYGILGSALGFTRGSASQQEFREIQSVWDFCEDHDRFLPAFRKELDDFLYRPRPDTSEMARPGGKSK
jgi:hypothetical protein